MGLLQRRPAQRACRAGTSPTACVSPLPKLTPENPTPPPSQARTTGHLELKTRKLDATHYEFGNRDQIKVKTSELIEKNDLHYNYVEQHGKLALTVRLKPLAPQAASGADQTTASSDYGSSSAAGSDGKGPAKKRRQS